MFIRRVLQAMREKAGKGNQEATDNIKRLKFRNYQPRDQTIAGMSNTEKDNMDEVVAPTGQYESVTSGNLLKKELRLHESEELNILPKSSNWDIKKSFEPKLEKLRRRTQRAIVDFLREKLNAATTDSEGDSDNDENEES